MLAVPYRRTELLVRETERQLGSRLSLFLLHDGSAHVIAAIGADDVGGQRRAALRAERQLLGLEGMMRAAAVRPGIGRSSFGDCHEINLIQRAWNRQIPNARQKLRGKRPNVKVPPNFVKRH